MKIELKIHCSDGKQDYVISVIDITQLIEKTVQQRLHAMASLQKSLSTETISNDDEKSLGK